MAYAAIISLKLTLQQILIHPYIFVRPREKKHIESFHQKLEFLQGFLEEHPSHESNEIVTFLERRITDAAYEAEDSMDLHLNNLCNSKEIIWQMEIEPMMKQVDSIIGDVTEIKEQMGLEIKPGRGSAMEYETKTGEFGKHKDFGPPNSFRKDSSSATKNLMVGFDDYLMQIKDQLTGQSSAREVISIVGMGGIGKTTLATNVYNDPYVVNHFDIRAWATVSQSYSVRDILLGMLDSMRTLTKVMLEESDAQLRLRVYQILKYRRYLIIVDDIWDTSPWDDLKMMFPPDEGTGSRIMLTTRIAEVAAYASPSGTLHQISLLSDDQSWKLLCAQYLKACFLYMAVFPRSHEILVFKLTEMWVAEGFLRQSDGQSPEELAERCVEDLLDRSLILKPEKNSEGKIKAFRIHDVLLDFCIEEARHEKFLQIIESRTHLFSTSPASERRISIHRVEELEHIGFHFDSMSSTSYVRSLVCLVPCPLSSDFIRLKLLRVLDATEVVFSQFPSQVLELLNLRYIALGYDGDIPVVIWIMEHLRHVRCDGYHLLNPTAPSLLDGKRMVGLRSSQPTATQSIEDTCISN